jgi:formate-dependent nitrite reductase membrane component NrfD
MIHHCLEKYNSNDQMCSVFGLTYDWPKSRPWKESWTQLLSFSIVHYFVYHMGDMELSVLMMLYLYMIIIFHHCSFSSGVSS